MLIYAVHFYLFIFFQCSTSSRSRPTRKYVLKHTWTAQIQKILHRLHSLIRAFAVYWYTCIHLFCKQSEKVLVRVCGCEGWSWPSLGANASKTHFRLMRTNEQNNTIKFQWMNKGFVSTKLIFPTNIVFTTLRFRILNKDCTNVVQVDNV